MIIKKLSQSVLLTGILTTSAYATEHCADTVMLNVGNFAQVQHAAEVDEHLPQELTLAVKNRTFRNEVANSTQLLRYTGTQANGVARTCIYGSEENRDLRLELKQHGRRAVTVKMLLAMSTDVQDQDYYIYNNDIVMEQRRPRSRSLRNGQSSFEGTLKSRNHYDYSCGFVDCTYTNDESAVLGKAQYTVSWTQLN